MIYRGFLVFGLALLVLALLSIHVALSAERAPPPPPSAEKCSMIQAAIEQFGEALVLSAARARGYSDAEIHSFRRACQKESRR